MKLPNNRLILVAKTSARAVNASPAAAAEAFLRDVD
jgi:hypothetical protein